ncbi:MAG: hypothetical protein V1835_03030 [Candidatus Micrarchaeota archaeon]
MENIGGKEEFAAKYPFSEKAKEYLARANITAISEKELENGKERLMQALNGLESARSKEHMKGIVRYVLARILLGALNNHAANAKFASYEAKNALSLLKTEEPEIVELLAGEFFPSLEMRGGIWDISTLDYLKYGGDLANENVENGRVYFENGRFMQLLRRAMQIKIADIAFSPKSLPENIRKYAEALRQDVEKSASMEGKFSGAFKGKYISLPAMQKILQGLPEGKRYYGSMSLAIACLKDGFSKEEAEQMMIAYARNCSKSTHAYTEREAIASLEWVYKHPTINFSLKTLREQGLVDGQTLKETELQYGKLSANRPRLRK